MANGDRNGSGVWLQWAVGVILTLILGWLAAITQISQGHTPLAYTAAVEARMHAADEDADTRMVKRLDRLEAKIDRLIERAPQ